jgi:hypothetical protein
MEKRIGKNRIINYTLFFEVQLSDSSSSSSSNPCDVCGCIMCAVPVEGWYSQKKDMTYLCSDSNYTNYSHLYTRLQVPPIIHLAYGPITSLA